MTHPEHTDLKDRRIDELEAEKAAERNAALEEAQRAIAARSLVGSPLADSLSDASFDAGYARAISDCYKAVLALRSKEGE